jgi:HlyD family secretion protein
METKRSGGGMKWLVIFAVIMAIAAAAFWYFKHSTGDAPQYQTDVVTRGELTQVVTATGTLNPMVNVTVGSQVSGRIIRLYADFNSVVKSNEVIAEIDPSTYEAQLNQSRANLANVKANLALQQANLKRAQELFTNNLIASADYDTAIAQCEQAAAQVKIQEAAVTNATANLNYCKLVSPVDGVVISRAVELGQTVASSFNTPTIFQIANDLTKMQIDTSVAEADVGGVAEGQSVDFTVDAYPTRTFHGTVTQVRNSPTTVNNVVTYDCVIGVTNSDYKLKPGMTATVSIIVAQRENALIIPNGALRFRPPEDAVLMTNAVPAQMAQGSNGGNLARASGAFGGRRGGGRAGGRGGEHMMFHTVYVLAGSGADAKLQPVQIRTGISDGLSTEVLSGLDEGAQVVTGVIVAGPQFAGGSNPFGGGFPRGRR